MRTWMLVFSTLVACSSSEPRPFDFSCKFPDAGVPCVCFDGDYRCHATCPMDLSKPCTPGDGCGDFSGGSAGEDCFCTCDAAGKWVCGVGGQTCIPS